MQGIPDSHLLMMFIGYVVIPIALLLTHAIIGIEALPLLLWITETRLLLFVRLLLLCCGNR